MCPGVWHGLGGEGEGEGESEGNACVLRYVAWSRYRARYLPENLTRSIGTPWVEIGAWTPRG